MISVIMPVHNAATTVPSALDSLIEQTHADWEVVAVDDGSSDASGTILQAYSLRDRRIRVVSTPHRGIVTALNTALDAARGDFIARMVPTISVSPIA